MSDTQTNDNGDDAAITQALQNLLNRHNNNTDAVAMLLFRENYQLRDTRRELQQQLQQAQAQAAQLQGQLPGEGTVVLNSEQAAHWQRYQELGTPDLIADTFQSYIRIERQNLVTQAAAAHGYEPVVLGDLLPQEAKLEIRKVKEADTEKSVAYIKLAEGDAQRLDLYVDNHLKHFLPALQKAAEPAPSGTPWPQQKGSQPPPKDKPVTKEELMNEKARTGTYTTL